MKTLRMIVGLVLIGVITLCAILIVAQLVGRVRVADLTEKNVYTLSEGTRRILAELNQPVTLKLYYSRAAARKGTEQIRFWNNYFLYVRDLLEEYASRSGGKLRLEVIDPRPYTDDEEKAVAHGLRRFQLTEEESFFFGLVAGTELGKEKIIEFFEPDRQEFVEYDLSKLIVGLMQREKKRVGVVSPLAVTGTDMSPYMMQMLRMQGRQPERPWHLVTHLRQTYDVQSVEIDNGTAPDVDFLMVIHPKDLADKALFAIDQYVMKGGKLMVFVDPHCVIDVPPQAMQNPMMAMQVEGSSSLDVLLTRWGVRMPSGQIAVDRALAMTVQLRQNAPPESFPAYLQLAGGCVNSEEVVSAELHGLRMLYAGALVRVPDAGTNVQWLLQTTKKGSTWTPESPFDLRIPSGEKIRRQMIDGSEPVMLGCLITGTLKTNFPNGLDQNPPEEDAGAAKDDEGGQETENADKNEDKPDTTGQKQTEKKAPEVLKESAPGAAVFVVADVDMLTDMMCYQEMFYGVAQVGNNPSFVFNMLDYLAGSQELISIRTRGKYSRPFEVVDRIEEEAEKATESEMQAVQAKLEEYRKQLEELGETPEDKDVKLIESQRLAKYRQVEEEIRRANKQLRDLQAKRRTKVESLERDLQSLNMVAAPGIILLIAIGLAVFRWIRRKRYAARRN